MQVVVGCAGSPSDEFVGDEHVGYRPMMGQQQHDGADMVPHATATKE